MCKAGLVHQEHWSPNIVSFLDMTMKNYDDDDHNVYNDDHGDDNVDDNCKDNGDGAVMMIMAKMMITIVMMMIMAMMMITMVMMMTTVMEIITIVMLLNTTHRNRVHGRASI